MDLGYLLYSFRNSIGDLSTPDYDQWLFRADGIGLFAEASE